MPSLKSELQAALVEAVEAEFSEQVELSVKRSPASGYVARDDEISSEVISAIVRHETGHAIRDGQTTGVNSRLHAIESTVTIPLAAMSSAFTAIRQGDEFRLIERDGMPKLAVIQWRDDGKGRREFTCHAA